MTQEELFRIVDYFAVGKRLPKEKGSLKDFKIVRMTAIEGEDYSKFEQRLIEKLGDTPKRGPEIRARQLKRLIERYTIAGKIFIIIINKAHLLNIRMLLCFKGIHEWGNKPETCPNFILMGDIEKINELIKKNDGIRLRASLIPGN